MRGQAIVVVEHRVQDRAHQRIGEGHAGGVAQPLGVAEVGRQRDVGLEEQRGAVRHHHRRRHRAACVRRARVMKEGGRVHLRSVRRMAAVEHPDPFHQDAVARQRREAERVAREDPPLHLGVQRRPLRAAPVGSCEQECTSGLAKP